MASVLYILYLKYGSYVSHFLLDSAQEYKKLKKQQTRLPKNHILMDTLPLSRFRSILKEPLIKMSCEI